MREEDGGGGGSRLEISLCVRVCVCVRAHMAIRSAAAGTIDSLGWLVSVQVHVSKALRIRA